MYLSRESISSSSALYILIYLPTYRVGSERICQHSLWLWCVVCGCGCGGCTTRLHRTTSTSTQSHLRHTLNLNAKSNHAQLDSMLFDDNIMTSSPSPCPSSLVDGDAISSSSYDDSKPPPATTSASIPKLGIDLTAYLQIFRNNISQLPTASSITYQHIVPKWTSTTENLNAVRMGSVLQERFIGIGSFGFMDALYDEAKRCVVEDGNFREAKVLILTAGKRS